MRRPLAAVAALLVFATCAASAQAVDTSAPTGASAGCDWTKIVLPDDRAAVDATVADAIARIPSASALPGYHGDDLKEASLGGIVQAHALLQRARKPLPLGDIAGAWQVRSLQAGGDSVYDYPFFRARIVRAGCGFDFAKTTGSQRRTGRLLPMKDSRTLAFLGTGTVNDDPTGPYGPGNLPRSEPMGSDPAVPVNSAGRLLRIGRNELLMLLDFGERGFELYHLKR